MERPAIVSSCFGCEWPSRRPRPPAARIAETYIFRIIGGSNRYAIAGLYSHQSGDTRSRGAVGASGAVRRPRSARTAADGGPAVARAIREGIGGTVRRRRPAAGRPADHLSEADAARRA